MKKYIFDGDSETLTVPYYGFREVKLIKDDKEFKGYTNGILCVDGETSEITFETSWLACNGYPEIKVEDIMILTKMPIKEKL